MAKQHENAQLKRYVRMLREAQANGWTIDALVEVALGAEALKPDPRKTEERPFIVQIYRESIGQLAR